MAKNEKWQDADEFDLALEFFDGSGRKANQRLKALFVLKYLQNNSDDETFVAVDDIIDYLNNLGIAAERRSIYKDIKEINVAHLMMRDGISFSEAEKWLQEDKEDALIQYKHLHGFYVKSSNRTLTPEDARLLAECVYSAKFIPAGREDFFIDLICSSLSDKQKEDIKHDVLLVDRISTNNKETLFNIDTIKDALSNNVKISFKYLKCTIKNEVQQVERKQGKDYVVSPYAMLINEGNYYLLAIDDADKKQKLKTYRIDRMRKVRTTEAPRIVTEDTKNLNQNLKSYARKVFSMYGGREERIMVRFTPNLLDSVVDRLGTRNVIYMSDSDNKHFYATASIEISKQFYGWLCGFGNQAKIMSPKYVADDFLAFLEGIKKKYES